MNYGIIQNRRHDRKRDGRAANASLLQDTRLREMAKQLGLGPKDLGHESARSLWQLLDDMAANDPDAYQRFVSEQLAAGPPQAERAEDESRSSNQPSHNDANQSKNDLHTDTRVLLPRYVTPYPGFVVKCAMLHSVKCQQQEIKLFLNCCAHEMVDMPKNPNSGKDVPEDTRAVPSTSNLEVPLAVGKLREIADVNGALSIACDVIFNPWVMRRCEWDANFKREVMKLAIHWVQQDAHVRLVHQVGKFIKSRYKGGTLSADGEIVTAKFLVEPPSQGSAVAAATDRAGGGAGGSVGSSSMPKSNQHDAHAVPSAMKSPSELLKQIQLNRNEDAATMPLESDFVITPAREVTAKTKPIVAKPSATVSPMQAKQASSGDATITSTASPEVVSTSQKNKLIEELDASPPKLLSPRPHEPVEKTVKSKTTTAVKKGFLLSASAKTKKPLYPTGSSEGHAPSPYVNLLSRSKVVDLGEVERQKHQEEQKRAQLAKDFTFLNSSPSQQQPPSSSANTDEVDCGDFEFEQLCMDVDPDLKPPNGGSSRDAAATAAAALDPVRELFGGGLEQLSHFLSP